MFISVTRLRVRRLQYMPAFLWYTFASQRQAKRATGFCGGRLLVDANRTYWTLTAWQDERAMRAFRGSGAHAQVMPRLLNWCDEAAYAHWLAVDSEVPDWMQAYEHLLHDGRLSRVAHPSANHEARRFVPPRPRIRPLVGRDLKPALRKNNGGSSRIPKPPES
jgi:hypothetical protein